MLHQDASPTLCCLAVALDAKAAPAGATLLALSHRDQENAGIFTETGVTF